LRLSAESQPVVVALVAWSVVAKKFVDVPFVLVKFVPFKRPVVVEFVDWSVVWKAVVVVAFVPCSVVAKSVVEVALVEVEFTEVRLVMVEVALLTRIGTEVVGESTPPMSSHAWPNPVEGHVVRQTSPVRHKSVVVKLVVVPLVARRDDAKRLVVVADVPWMVVAKSDVEVALVVVEFSPVKFWSVEEAKATSPPQNCEAVDEVALRYAMVGDEDAPIDVPSEYSHPCPKDVCPVPPFATESVPEMVESVVVATQVGTPSRYART
jgi:hypothetical protein